MGCKEKFKVLGKVLLKGWGDGLVEHGRLAVVLIAYCATWDIPRASLIRGELTRLFFMTSSFRVAFAEGSIS